MHGMSDYFWVTLCSLGVTLFLMIREAWGERNLNYEPTWWLGHFFIFMLLAVAASASLHLDRLRSNPIASGLAISAFLVLYLGFAAVLWRFARQWDRKFFLRHGERFREAEAVDGLYRWIRRRIHSRNSSQ